MSAAISVIIPTWNKRALLEECLQSLDKQIRPADEILVVDDGSTDDTRAWLADHWSGVRVVALERNRGFAAAVNTGIREAAGDYLVLLNNDMTLDSQFLELLEKRANAGVDMVAPLILWKDSPERIYAAGDRQRVNGRPEAIGFREARDSFQLPERIFGVSAGAALYRREVFDRVGLLDERFVAYFEDSDLSFRARLAGFTAELEPAAIAYHVGSASLGGKTWWRSRQCCRNHTLLVWKNMPARLIARHFIAIKREQWHQLAMAFRSARTEFGAMTAAWLILGIYADWLRLLIPMMATRRHIQRSRTLSVHDLAHVLTPPTSPE